MGVGVFLGFGANTGLLNAELCVITLTGVKFLSVARKGVEGGVGEGDVVGEGVVEESGVVGVVGVINAAGVEAGGGLGFSFGAKKLNVRMAKI